jgi:hypothetical protein
MKEMRIHSHFPHEEIGPISRAKRRPRMTNVLQRGQGWRAKVHPFFIRCAEYQKKVTILTNSGTPGDQEEATRLSLNLPKDLLNEADKLHDEMQATGTPRRRSSLSIYGLEGKQPGTKISTEHYMYHWLCWFKYNKTVERLVAEYAAGDFCRHPCDGWNFWKYERGPGDWVKLHELRR